MPGENSVDGDRVDVTMHDHPLNSTPGSKWQTFFKDNEVLLQIDKDVRYLMIQIYIYHQCFSLLIYLVTYFFNYFTDDYAQIYHFSNKEQTILVRQLSVQMVQSVYTVVFSTQYSEVQMLKEKAWV